MRGVGGLLRQVGLRHLRERGLRSALTVGGIAAGVALVFSITSMNAAINEAIGNSVGAFDGPAELQVTAVTAGSLDDEVVAELREVEGVATVAPLLQVRSVLRVGDREVNAFVVGATADLLAFAPDLDASIDPTGIAIGQALADRLGVRRGDTIGVVTPRRTAELLIGGVLPAGPIDKINDGLVAALPLPVAQELFDRAGSIDLVLIDVAGGSGPEVDAARDDIEGLVGSAGAVSAPDDAPGGRSENVRPFLLLSESIAMTSLFVALVLVANTMAMAMAERRVELALAAALGARRRQLFLAVLAEAAVVGALGVVVGLGAGALLADQLMGVAGTAYRSVLPIDPPSGAVLVGPHLFLAAYGGIAVAVLGAVLPARRVLRTAPVAALRPANDYEWTPDLTGRRSLVPVIAGVALLAIGLGLGMRLEQGAPSAMRTGVIMVSILAGVTALLPSALPLLTDRIARILARGWGVIGRLAGDSLRANPRRTSITVVTLILPLGTVIGMGTAFSSAQAEFHRLASAFLATPLLVQADPFFTYTALQPLPDDAIEDLESVPGVKAALPAHNAFLDTPDGLLVIYANPTSLAQRLGVPASVADSTLADDPAEFTAGLTRGEVVVSRLTSRDRGVGVGDELTLPTAHGPVAFRVASVFDDLAGVPTLYMDRDTYRQHWPVLGANGFGIALDDGADVAAVEARLERVVDDLGIPAKVLRRDAAVENLESGLTGLFSISRATQLAAVIVAALSLASACFTTVVERRWTFGLQRALGMSRSQIARSLALEVTAVAIIGAIGAAVLGVAIGVLLGQSFSVVTAGALPLVIPWTVVIACAVGALALSLLATAYPRRLATRVEIIEALAIE